MKILIDDIEPNCGINTWRDAIMVASEKLYEAGYVTKEFGENCIKREEVYPTGLETDFPVAIPHTESEFVNETAISVLRLKNTISFRNMDGSDLDVDVHYVFNLAIKEKNNQVVFLSKIIGLVQNSKKLNEMFNMNTEMFEKEFLKMMN